MTLEEEEAKFYESLGRALSAFAGVEGAMYHLFSVLLTGAPGGSAKAGVVFGNIENFRSKLNVLSELVCYTIRVPELLRRWEELRTSLDRRARKRNQLAHCDVVQESDKAVSKRIRTIPSMTLPQTVIDLSDGSVTSFGFKDIDAARMEFLQAMGEVHRLAHDIELLFTAAKGESSAPCAPPAK